MADKSVSEPVVNIPKEQAFFTKKFIGCTDNADFITLDSWVRESGVSGDLALQMDIEGGEYFALLNASDALLARFRIIVLEIHNLQFLWEKHYFDLVKTALGKILKTHYCVHLHPNNYCGEVYAYEGVTLPPAMECSFLRKDRFTGFPAYATAFPHPLDAQNVANRPPLILPKNWYRAKNSSKNPIKFYKFP